MTSKKVLPRWVGNAEIRIKQITASIDLMTKYTGHKLDIGDWHGVADGAMDIRDLEAEKKGLQEALNLFDPPVN